MQNFFEKDNKNSSNPFSVKRNVLSPLNKPSKTKRLNITDNEVLNSSSDEADIDFLETRMNNLYKIISKKPNNIDPIELENMTIEWENLRDKIYKEKQKAKNNTKLKNKAIKTIKKAENPFKKLITLFKFNTPKIKEIMKSFNEINAEVENLVKNSAPVGEEELKYGILINKINQASRLNYKLTNEIK